MRQDDLRVFIVTMSEFGCGSRLMSSGWSATLGVRFPGPAADVQHLASSHLSATEPRLTAQPTPPANRPQSPPRENDH
jgi:hypothetical protein